MKKTPIISVKNLHKTFKVGKNNVDVLKGMDLDIYPGEFVIILGPSGCGKSTLLNTIIGLEKPTNGEVYIRHHDLFHGFKSDDERSIFRRKNIGMVYQQANWIKSLNVIENVEFPLRMTELSSRRVKKRALNILDLMGMSEFAKYHPAELSGGQQQRVSMARALIANPQIIVADEPTGNLDTISATDVMSVFKYINDESHRTILLVTHNLDYEKYATKVVYVRDGVIEKIKDKGNPNADAVAGQDLLEMALEAE
jgi:putative ABC transport system ATP-binding protein